MQGYLTFPAPGWNVDSGCDLHSDGSVRMKCKSSVELDRKPRVNALVSLDFDPHLEA